MLIKDTISKEEATMTLAGFYPGSLFWLNGNLQILWVLGGWGGGKPERNPWSEVKTSNEPNLHMALSWHQTWATLVSGEDSHHYAFPAPIGCWMEPEPYWSEVRTRTTMLSLLPLDVEWNLGHIDQRWGLSPLRFPCSHWMLIFRSIVWVKRDKIGW